MKGFVGGIPIALLAAAAQAMEHGTQNTQGMQTHSHYPHVGGTAMGGPSGNDADGGFTGFSTNVNTKTDVDEYSKDDHSVKIKDTDVYPPLRPVFGPGEGPFPKRSLYPHYGGTGIGGPSGNDEGQTFDMPITANVQTTVDEYAKDDHSVKVKDTDVHRPPVFVPTGPPHSAHGFSGSPAGFGGPAPGFRQTANPTGDHYHVPAAAFEKRWGPEEHGGTAMGGPSGGDGDDNDDAPRGFDGPFVSGGTAMGGPSGDDDGISFSNPTFVDVHNNVNEYSKDDHSVDIKNKDIYPHPFVPFGGHHKRGWEPELGGTAMGGPSGDDGGQTFSAPITVDVTTGVHEHYEDDHSIDLQHEDVYSPPSFAIAGGPGPVIPHGGAPFRRAYRSPDRVADGGTAMGGPSGGDGDDNDDAPHGLDGPFVSGGTAMGGPSGEDGGVSFSNPTSVGVDSNVNEHSEDDHSIKVDTTHVHPPAAAVPHMPWMPYQEATVEHPGPVAVPEAETIEATPAPPATPSAPISEVHEEQAASPSTPREDQDNQEQVPQCAAQTHEVVRTVTKTQYKEVHPTLTVYATPVVSHAVLQTTAAVHMSATPEETYVDPKVVYSAPVAPSSSIPYHIYNSQSPMSSSVAYSMIPVHVPVATPSSSNVMLSVATPSSSHGLPIGADALQRPSTSAKPSAVMFQGSAARVSGGIASVAAAVVGVLAFVL
ncbi:uncharacterized protein N7496_000816 [Penicillium cataractarum]|uniref:GPI anchored protein n=1 Tax=Penicillium cataractarum TaxID=2100454 RepID=A0A9X0B6B2_9EURO|nr:uncharacterized protein N7496_000816 [Penicillium cataractarum]KAJ5389748.1 hypothetical protein N7496_000816 [Penicillium cataractarum]